MPVDYQHKEYTKNIKKWQLIRDADEGSIAVKSRSKGGTVNTINGLKGTAYLPAPDPTDLSDENKERYAAYVDRASYVNFTAQTKEGMLGMVFRKKTSLQLDSSIDYMERNINGGGLTADQFIKDLTAEVLCLGRFGLLVDYPQADQGLTEAQVKAQELRASIIPYESESIINWQSENIGGIKKLSMVVLREPFPVQSEDGFEETMEDYHRVLLLKNGVYVQNIYDESGSLVSWATGGIDDNGDDEFISDIIPLKSNGETWSEIPFQFVGSTNNDTAIDKAPLYDIADINIAHYRNSADFEESAFMVGQPTPAIAGLTQSWVNENYPNGVKFGSRTALLLPESGSAVLLQASPNQMPQMGMQDKEKQLIKLGARLIQDQGGVETAEAAKIRFAGQNSKIASILVNVESAMEQVFMWAGEFMGATSEPEVEINKELYDKTTDPQMIMAQIQLMDRAVIAKKDLRDNLRKSNLIDPDRSDDEIDTESESVDIF